MTSSSSHSGATPEAAGASFTRRGRSPLWWDLHGRDVDSHREAVQPACRDHAGLAPWRQRTLGGGRGRKLEAAPVDAPRAVGLGKSRQDAHSHAPAERGGRAVEQSRLAEHDAVGKDAVLGPRRLWEGHRGKGKRERGQPDDSLEQGASRCDSTGSIAFVR